MSTSGSVLGGADGASAPARDAGSGASSDPAATGGSAGGSSTAAPLPTISVPRGGGAIRGIGEKFAVNPANGTASVRIPLAVSPGRGDFGPTISLAYDSGAGNGAYGIGWGIGTAQVSRRTDQGLPRYRDTDVFLLSDAEDLVPLRDGDDWARVSLTSPAWADGYRVDAYRPRIEGLYARIERWTRLTDGDAHWRTVSRDNITTWFGLDASARITDPEDPSRVFTWLVSRSDDPLGNAMAYSYRPDDATGVDTGAAHERNRTPAVRGTDRLLQRISYGNRVSTLTDPTLANPGWMFEIVFDYGDHDPDAPVPAPDRPWPARDDAFSRYRAGFEVRTHRLCRRILQFHHFPDAPGVGANTLVRSADLGYDTGGPAGALLTSVTECGYRRTGTGYLRRALPPVEFTYSPADLQDTLSDVDPDSAVHIPAGLSDGYEFVDLDGDGIAGVLSRSAPAWRYAPNLGGGRFGVPRDLPTAPHGGGRATQLLDLSGGGQMDVVAFGGPTPGYAERDGDRWRPYAPFVSLPTADLASADIRFVDLDGDGRADVLLFDESSVTWHPSLARDGFGPAGRHSVPWDEEAGPRLVFRDDAEAIFLADMSGDGLADLVRVRVGAVCYWPNLGYGRFGAKVTMDGAPWLDRVESFDHSRVRLADVDGSGTADLVYLDARGARVSLNRSGNSFAEVRVIRSFPYVDGVTLADLGGTGTTSLIWSAPGPGDERRSLRYADLLGGVKPHLLTGVDNNLGSRTTVNWASSTAFRLADRAAGTPWLTRLPFPVHVVTSVEVADLVSRDRFVTRYAYHHGYFDPVEREFRGFGMVEQWDTAQYATLAASDPLGGTPPANEDAASHVPPLWTKTWFHTGAFVSAEAASRQYAAGYWTEPGLTGAQVEALRPQDSVWPTGIRRPDGTIVPMPATAGTAEDLREASRTLKGSTLRREVYAWDDRSVPYLVEEHAYTIDLLQPRLPGDRHAVCQLTERETVALAYDRAPVGTAAADPRVRHQITLDVDGYGNPLREVVIGYGRRYPDADLDASLGASAQDAVRAAQSTALVTLTVQAYTNPVDDGPAHRAPLGARTDRFELLHAVPSRPAGAPTALVRPDDLRTLLAGPVTDLDPADVAHAGATGSGLYRRRFAALRTRYDADDLSGPLPVGMLHARGLKHADYRLALTPDVITAMAAPMPLDAAVLTEAGYATVDGEPGWWIPTPTLTYAPAGTDTPAAQLAFALAHFFRPHRATDAFGTVSEVGYDADALLATATRDPFGNTTAAEIDYRTLQPVSVTDPNGNRTALAWDTLGFLAAQAVMGQPGRSTGDDLTGLDPDPVEETLLAGATGDPSALLAAATTRFATDTGAFRRSRATATPQPAATVTLARSTHVADLTGAAVTDIEVSLAYADGLGRQIQRKQRVEPGRLTDGGPVVAARWITSGWTVRDNKNQVVRRFEPFYAADASFQPAVATGVSEVRCYDPVGRTIGTLYPDGSFEATRFGPWRQDSYDRGDTVRTDPRTDPAVGDAMTRILAADPSWSSWYDRRAGGALGAAARAAATQAAAYADTPSSTYPDVLGRSAVHVVRTATEVAATVTAYDIEGRALTITDPLGRTAARQTYDLAGRRLGSVNLDAGLRGTLPDVAGVPVRGWNGRGYAFRTTYDALRRPLDACVTPPGGTEQVATRTAYGESVPDAAAHNLRTRAHTVRDGAGTLVTGDYDVSGAPTTTVRTFPADYRQAPDWAAPVPLETDAHTSTAGYDALGRPIVRTLPDGTTVATTYGPGGRLAGISAAPAGRSATGYLSDVVYNARGQVVSAAYGNGVTGARAYDPETFRAIRHTAARAGSTMQDLTWVYDPVGNPTSVADAAAQTVFFRNTAVAPGAGYTYDAAYRLIAATGREHLGQHGPEPTSASDATRVGVPHPADGQAMGRYTETYTYDLAGAVQSLRHQGSDPASPGWTRTYAYHEPSATDPATISNRLSTTTDGTDPAVAYSYDAHGNTLTMPGLSALGWDAFDRLASAACAAPADGGAPRTVFYAYDASGARVRTVTENQAAPGRPATARLVAGDWSTMRTYTAGVLDVERQTVEITAGDRIALIETRTHGTDAGTAALDRYVLADPAGSALLEVDGSGAIIDYEEYYPYGGTAYQGVRSAVETPKRFRFAGAERDADTGLYAMGARYYAPWLGRWLSPDPAGTADDLSGYAYARNNPVRYRDPTGRQSQDPQHAAPATTAAPAGAAQAAGNGTAPSGTPPGTGGAAPTPPAGDAASAEPDTATPTADSIGQPAPPYASIAQSNARLTTLHHGRYYALIDTDLNFSGSALVAFPSGPAAFASAGPGNLASFRIGLPSAPAWSLGAYASAADDLHIRPEVLSFTEGASVQYASENLRHGFFGTVGLAESSGSSTSVNATGTYIYQRSPNDHWQIDGNAIGGLGSSGSLYNGTPTGGYLTGGVAGSGQYNNWLAFEAGGTFTGLPGAGGGAPFGEVRLFGGVGFTIPGRSLSDNTPAAVVINLDVIGGIPTGGVGAPTASSLGGLVTVTFAMRHPFRFQLSTPPPSP